MTPTTPPVDLSPLRGDLADLSTTLALLAKHAKNHADDMDPKAASHWHKQLGLIEDAIRALECDYCEQELANRQYYQELVCDKCLTWLKARDGESEER